MHAILEVHTAQAADDSICKNSHPFCAIDNKFTMSSTLHCIWLLVSFIGMSQGQYDFADLDECQATSEGPCRSPCHDRSDVHNMNPIEMATYCQRFDLITLRPRKLNCGPDEDGNQRPNTWFGVCGTNVLTDLKPNSFHSLPIYTSHQQRLYMY